MTSFYLGLLIILIVAIIAGLLYVRTVARSTFNIEDLLSPPWDDNNASSAKTVASGAKPRKATRKTPKKVASIHSKPKGKSK